MLAVSLPLVILWESQTLRLSNSFAEYFSGCQTLVDCSIIPQVAFIFLSKARYHALPSVSESHISKFIHTWLIGSTLPGIARSAGSMQWVHGQSHRQIYTHLLATFQWAMCSQKAVYCFPTHSKNGVVGRKAAANQSSQNLLCNSGSWICPMRGGSPYTGLGAMPELTNRTAVFCCIFGKCHRELAPPK